jgi:MerR family transcriptional regulator/heat shock protein HspR
MADQRDRAVFVISVAAELAGVHPQTLRIYGRRAWSGQTDTANARRYSSGTSSGCWRSSG